MGARQSKRSVDISGATKKGELESGVEDGKLERLEEGDIAPKATQNGTAPHADKDAPPVIEEVGELVNGDATTTETEIAQEQKETAEAANKEENLANGTPENPEAKEKTTEEAAATPDKEKKKKEKPKKKWSFRSISFSRKDKSKPNVAKDETLNGNVTKEEPVAEVVEAEGAAVTEAIPVKDEEPKKEGDAPERVEEEEKKEKTETTTETEPQSTEPASPVPAPVEPVPAPVESAPTPVEPAPAPAPVPEPVAEPTPAPEPTVPAPVETPAPETVPEPIVEAAPAPRAVESTPEPVQEEEVQATPVPEVESVLQAVTEVKIEELPPPLPASPPPTEAPPPTPVATIPDVSLHVDSLADTQETEVVGGGESMAEPEDVEPVLEEEIIVNGISPEQFIEEFSEKVEIGTENFKTIVTESIISNQVSENSEDNSEQTASAAE